MALVSSAAQSFQNRSLDGCFPARWPASARPPLTGAEIRGAAAEARRRPADAGAGSRSAPSAGAIIPISGMMNCAERAFCSPGSDGILLIRPGAIPAPDGDPP